LAFGGLAHGRDRAGRGDDSAWAVLTMAGLAGTWAPSCTAPVTSDNRRLTYFADASGQARRRIDSGTPSGEPALAVEAASVPSPGLVRFKALRGDARWVGFLIEVADNRHRAADDASRRPVRGQGRRDRAQRRALAVF